MQRSFTLTLLLLLLTACLLCSTVARAEETLTSTPAVMITPIVGPPTTNVLVSGTGFDPNVAVDIYFDKTDLALATTNGAGAFGRASVFGGIALQVPASALPGTHWITARERSGKAAQKSFLVRTDWAQFHFSPDHKGLNPYENVLSQTTVGSMDLRWSYPAGTRTYYSSPTVANGVVYVGSVDDNLYALNATTGALQWTYATNYWDLSSPTVANGVVYVDSDALYALNASTGALLWSFTGGNAAGYSVAVANGVVYAGLFQLYALNASTGALLWEYSTGDFVSSPSPAVANGIVYVGSFDGNVYAFGLPSGQSSESFSPPGRPDPSLLVPDWTLKPSTPVSGMPSN